MTTRMSDPQHRPRKPPAAVCAGSVSGTGLVKASRGRAQRTGTSGNQPRSPLHPHPTLPDSGVGCGQRANRGETSCLRSICKNKAHVRRTPQQRPSRAAPLAVQWALLRAQRFARSPPSRQNRPSPHMQAPHQTARTGQSPAQRPPQRLHRLPRFQFPVRERS